MSRSTPLSRLKDLAATMKELGLTSATLSDGTAASMPLAARAPIERQAVPARKGCICKHPLSRHNGIGQCLDRNPDGSPCNGPCGITEGGTT